MNVQFNVKCECGIEIRHTPVGMQPRSILPGFGVETIRPKKGRG